MGSLAGRRVLIAGGASGIGRGIVEHLCRAGSRVAFTGPSQRQGAATAEETGAAFLAADTADPAAIRASAGQAAERLGGLDGLVLAAGVMHAARISTTSDDEWDRVIDANLTAPLRLVQACFPLLRRDGGAIVAIASGAAHGVRVNAVCPGAVVPGVQSTIAGYEHHAEDSSKWGPAPSGRHGEGIDIAQAVLWLASDAAGHVSGATLRIDGAASAAMRAAACV